MGLGVWGSRLFAKLVDSPEFEVVAVLDPAPAISPVSIPVCKKEEDFWRFAFDAVVVSGPPAIQGSLGIEVLRRGLSLFIEKPMALSEEVAEELASLSRKKGLIVHVDHLVRYDALHVRALDLISSGGLGELAGSVHVRFGARPRPGLAPHWVLMPHDLSLAHAAFGDEGQWEATLVASGTLARRSRARAEKILLWCGAEGPSRRQTLYLGSRRTVLVSEGQRLSIFPALEPGLKRLLGGPLAEETIQSLFGGLAGEPPLEEHVAEGDALSASLGAFARAVHTGRPSVCDASDGVRVTRALLAVDASIERGLGVNDQLPSLMISTGSRKSSSAEEGESGASLKR